MYVVDASVWVSRFLPDDEYHQVSRDWLGEVLRLRIPVVGPSLLLAEVAGALARRLGDGALGMAAVRDIARFRRWRLVSLMPPSPLLTARLAADLRLRGADATYVAAALQAGCLLVTWDEELKERSGSLVEAARPSSV